MTEPARVIVHSKSMRNKETQVLGKVGRKIPEAGVRKFVILSRVWKLTDQEKRGLRVFMMQAKVSRFLELLNEDHEYEDYISIPTVDKPAKVEYLYCTVNSLSAMNDAGHGDTMLLISMRVGPDYAIALVRPKWYTPDLTSFEPEEII